MTCREVVDFLLAYHAGELPQDERHRFEEHVEHCAACRTYLETYRQTVAAAKDACRDDDAPPPEELVDAILAARQRRR